MPRTNSFFNVAPRYTGGSPAMVDETTALRVASQERTGHAHATEGAYGPEEQEKASRLGLGGIVERVTEKRDGFHVHDILTGETFIRPFKVRGKGEVVEYLDDASTWRRVRLVRTTGITGRALYGHRADAAPGEFTLPIVIDEQAALSARRIRIRTQGDA